MGTGGHAGLGYAAMELWVYDDTRVATAADLIEQELVTAVEGNPWTCGKCGEENDAAFETCWKCQQSPQ